MSYFGYTGAICILLIGADMLFIMAFRMFGIYYLGTEEFVRVALTGMVFFSLSWTQARRKHIQIEILTIRSPSLKLIANLCAYLMGIFLFSLLGVKVLQTAVFFNNDIFFTEANIYPDWPIRGLLVPVASFVLCVQFMVDAVIDIRHFAIERRKSGHIQNVGLSE